MIDILIVEDEKLEREAITNMVATYLNTRFHLLISANNGEQGLEEFKKHPVSLVITDINTPRKSGLEMLKEIKKLSPDIKTIVLTGYDYFQYAQEAIRIGVDDFILKPASQKDLCDRIVKIMDMIEQDKQQADVSINQRFREIQSILQSDLIYAILYNDSQQHIEKYFSIFHLDVKSAVCFCMFQEDITIEQMNKLTDVLNKQKTVCLFEIYFEYIVIFIFHHAYMDFQDVSSIYQIFYTLKKEAYHIGVGGVKIKVSEFYQSFVEALDNLKSGEVFDQQLHEHQMSDDVSFRKIDEFADEIMNAVKGNHVSATTQITEKLYNMIIMQEYTKRKDLFHVFLKQLMKKLTAFDQSGTIQAALNEQMKQLDYFDNTHDMRIYITYLVKSIVDPLIYDKRKKSNKLIVKAYDFIEKNYHRAIGLNDLAAYLEVTPQYISSLLSQHANNNFTNILAEYRVEKAKYLLDSNRKIKEIAALVGFQNQNYFAKTFKKITGITPKEFKNLDR